MEEGYDYVYENVHEKVWIEENGWAPKLVDKIVERLRGSNPSISDDARAIVVRSKEINAYAVTGNYIYLSRSLIERCPNEETVAFIIAHELAHQTLGHLDIIPDWAIQPLKRLPAILRSPPIIFFAVLDFLQKSFRPRIECDADLAGLNFCINAGYEPDKCIALFDILERVALNRRAFRSNFGPDDECDDELNEKASFSTKFNIWIYYLSTRSLPIRDRREFLLQNLESRGFPREKKRRVTLKHDESLGKKWLRKYYF